MRIKIDKLEDGRLLYVGNNDNNGLNGNNNLNNNARLVGITIALLRLIIKCTPIAIYGMTYAVMKISN